MYLVHTFHSLYNYLLSSCFTYVGKCDVHADGNENEKSCGLMSL